MLLWKVMLSSLRARSSMSPTCDVGGSRRIKTCFGLLR